MAALPNVESTKKSAHGIILNFKQHTDMHFVRFQFYYQLYFFMVIKMYVFSFKN